MIDGVEKEEREVLLMGKRETASLVLSLSPEVGVLIKGIDNGVQQLDELK